MVFANNGTLCSHTTMQPMKLLLALALCLLVLVASTNAKKIDKDMVSGEDAIKELTKAGVDELAR